MAKIVINPTIWSVSMYNDAQAEGMPKVFREYMLIDIIMQNCFQSAAFYAFHMKNDQ